MRKTPRFALLAALAAALCILPTDLAAQVIWLRAGTLIHCTLEEPNFSSRTAALGEPVLCYLRPLREFRYSAFPRGSYLVGEFRDYQDPGRFVGKGWMKLEFDRLILGPNTEVPVATKVVSVRKYRVDAEGRILGRGHPKRDAALWMFPPLWPVKLITLPMRGPRPTLKGELPLTLRLMDDAEIPVCTPRPEPIALDRLGPAPPEAEYQEQAARRPSRRIPLLDQLRDLAYPFIGERDSKSDVRRRVEQALGQQ